MTVEIVDLAGDAFSRGSAFGRMRQGAIEAFNRDWLASLRAVGIGDPHAYLARMLRETDFLSAVHTHAPDLLEEVRGMAAGCGQPFELMLCSQLMDEEWAYRPQVLRHGEAMQKCSSVAVLAGDDHTWLGQNMDLGSYTDGHQVLMRAAPCTAQPGALVFTIGGMIALLGANSRSVGVCVNSLPQLPAARAGIPVAFVIRKLLQARDIAEAVETLRKLPHATGQHYLIAAPGSLRSFEASPDGVLEYRPPDASRVLHTNHPLASAQSEGLSVSTPYHANSAARLRALSERLSAGTPGLAEIMAALCSSDNPDHPVCRARAVPRQSDAVSKATAFTTGSMIAALRRPAAATEAWVSAGPPVMSGYERVVLKTTLP